MRGCACCCRLFERTGQLERKERVAARNLPNTTHQRSRKRVTEALLQQTVERAQAQRGWAHPLETVLQSRLQGRRAPVALDATGQHENRHDAPRAAERRTPAHPLTRNRATAHHRSPRSPPSRLDSPATAPSLQSPRPARPGLNLPAAGAVRSREPDAAARAVTASLSRAPGRAGRQARRTTTPSRPPPVSRRASGSDEREHTRSLPSRVPSFRHPATPRSVVPAARVLPHSRGTRRCARARAHARRVQTGRSARSRHAAGIPRNDHSANAATLNLSRRLRLPQ